MKYGTDSQYEDHTIKTAQACKDGGWSLTFVDGWSFYCPAGAPIVPKPGMIARQWGQGVGYPVRGLAINGHVVYYRTEEEDNERHRQQCEKHDQQKRDDFELNRVSLDMRYDALPQCFRDRIDRFRRNNPDFRWEYEPYEMLVCEDAVKIARACGSMSRVEAFSKKPWDEQVAQVPTLFDGHSGNSFGMAMRLAHDFLLDEDRVRQRHGALATLVGSEVYGCIPRDLANGKD